MRGRAAGNGGAGGAGSVMYARGLNWLGDAVISLPALAAAKRGWEGGLLVAARGAGAALYRLLPGAGEVLDDPRGAGNRLRLAGELRKRPIAMALLWQNSFSAALTALLAGIPRRAGWNRHGRRWLLTDWKDPSPEDLAAHEIFYHLKPVALAGMEAPFSLPALPAPGLPSHGPGAAGPLSPELSAEDPALPEGAHPALRAALGGAPGAGAPDGGFLLALAPGASYGGAKRWPAASFAQAARLILEGRRGSAVILGGAGEIEASSETERLLGGGPPCVNLAGKTGLGECARVLAASGLALTNDSGLMHLACALGTPTVTPFGPTSPFTTGPLGLKSAVLRTPAACSPCFRRKCPLKTRVCFENATPLSAAEAAFRLLADPGDPPSGPGGPAAPAVFCSSVPEGAFLPPEGATLLFALPESLSGDPRLEEARAAPLLPGAPPEARNPGPARAPVTGKPPLPPFRAPAESFPAPAASFRGHPVYFVPEGLERAFYEDISRGLGLDPARSCWLASDARPLATARAFGGRAGMWLEKGRGLPEGTLAGSLVPGICAPDFQGALDWAGASR